MISGSKEVIFFGKCLWDFSFFYGLNRLQFPTPATFSGIPDFPTLSRFKHPELIAVENSKNCPISDISQKVAVIH